MTNKTPEQMAQEYAPNDKLREYLAITTPEDKAAEWVSRRVEFSGEDESPNISHLIDKELKVAFLAGHAAGKQEERERILAILDHGCGQAPVQFTYAELRREIHEITEEDCYTGGEKV